MKMSSPSSLFSTSISSSPRTTDISTLFVAVRHHDELANMSLLDFTGFIQRAHLLKELAPSLLIFDRPPGIFQTTASRCPPYS
jgi:hypothetical protein